MRIPMILGIKLVRSYDEFVDYLSNNPMPELISFDHDLSIEHYAVFEDKPGVTIPYDTYVEKTGYHCAQYIVDNGFDLTCWAVHSFNPVGKRNIQNLLRSYCPKGEVFGLQIPFSTKG
jgi:hypothetical protein